MTDPLLSIRRPALVGLGALAVLVLGFGLWSVLTRIEGAVVASGQIEVDQDRQVVQHPDGGVVAEIRVRDGSLVAAGDLLLRLDGSALQSERAILVDRATDLRLQTARLLAERDGLSALPLPDDLARDAPADPALTARIAGETSLFQARLASLTENRRLLDQRILQFRAEVDGLSAQSHALATELALVQADLADQRSLLAKGLVPAARVSALEREVARLTGTAGQVAAALARARDAITAVEIERAGLATLRREEAAARLRDLEPALLEVQERLRALEGRIARLEIRAPVSGIVLGLQATTPRSVLRPADPVLFLVPQDRPLVVSARISPLAIDAVAVGQLADLVFPAFRDSSLPPLLGHVTRLSPDALTDSTTGAAFYAAELALPADQAARLGDHVLVPGMPVEVYVRTGSHTPLAYLLRPFSDYFRRAMRES